MRKLLLIIACLSLPTGCTDDPQIFVLQSHLKDAQQDINEVRYQLNQLTPLNQEDVLWRIRTAVNSSERDIREANTVFQTLVRN